MRVGAAAASSFVSSEANQEDTRRQREAEASFLWHRLIADVAAGVGDILRMSAHSWSKGLQRPTELEQGRADGMQVAVGWVQGSKGFGGRKSRWGAEKKNKEKEPCTISLSPPDEVNPEWSCSESGSNDSMK